MAIKKTKDKTTNTYSLRLPAELRDKLLEVADKQDRTLSNLMLHYVKEGLKRDSE